MANACVLHNHSRMVLHLPVKDNWTESVYEGKNSKIAETERDKERERQRQTERDGERYRDRPGETGRDIETDR